VPGPVKFMDFLERTQGHDAARLAADYPLGCLLDAANPTRSSQKAAHVVPLLRNDGKPGRVVVGRDAATCDVVCGSPSVSRRHACFELQGDRIVLIDLGSQSGTHVGAQRLAPTEPATLPPGAISELWLGEEGFYHFGPSALAAYLRHLGNASRGSPRPAPAAPASAAPAAAAASPSPAPVVGPPPTNRIPKSTATTQRVARVVVPTAEEEAAREASWKKAMAAVVQLGPTASTVEVDLAVDDRPITIFDAEHEPGGLPQALRALEGLRAGVRRIRVTLRKTKFPIVVFERK
jgi:hypothetical protein